MPKWIQLFLLFSAAVASPAQAVWREASSQHFVIYSEQSEKSLREFAESLERYDKGLRFLFKRPDEQLGPANRVNIFVVRSVSAVQRIGSTGWGALGFYKGRAAGSVAFVPRSTGSEWLGFDSLLILQHEYAHHFQSQNFGGVFPAWFIEGFAEFASTAEREKNGSVSFGKPAQHRAYTLLGDVRLPVEKLLAPPEKPSASEVDGLYAFGWLLCHYLIFEPSRKGQLADYLAHLSKGKSSVEAAQAAFGDIKKLDADLKSYLKRRRFTTVGLSPELLPIGTISLRELGPGEAAIMDVRMRSRAGVTKEQAAELVPLARRAAAPFPSDVAVQSVLAEAEFDAGNYKEAEAAADRALATDPKAVEALIYKGRARMALVEADAKSDDQAWREVRKWFLAANRIDPDDPEPLILFYRSFRAQGKRPTENATTGLLQALALAPQDDELRLTAAAQFLSDGKVAPARAALAPVAYDPHGGDTSKLALSVLLALDQGGAAEALRQWESFGSKQAEEEKSKP